MTPMWREAIKARLNEPKSAVPVRKWQRKMSTDFLVRARCFDLREIQSLCHLTSIELLEAAKASEPSHVMAVERGPPSSLKIDLGPGACVPAPITWLEFDKLFVVICDGDPWAKTYTSFVVRGQHIMWIRTKWTAADTIDETDEFALFHVEDGVVEVSNGSMVMKPGDGGFGQLSPHVRNAVFMALAGLAAINSPAAQREPVEAHRGLERRMRQAGITVPPAIAHTKVTIGRGRGGSSYSVHAGHPKAYHFCRAHTRFKLGKLERVRAHWRGDPAFGVRLPSYQVKAPQDSEGHSSPT